MTDVYISCPHCASTRIFSWVKNHTLHCNDCLWDWEELRVHPTVDVCDFCSSPSITKDYACETFEAFNLGNVQANSSGRWASCADCAKLIDAGEWEVLALRCLDALEVEPKNEYERTILLDFIRNLHKEFREWRLRVN